MHNGAVRASGPRVRISLLVAGSLGRVQIDIEEIASLLMGGRVESPIPVAEMDQRLETQAPRRHVVEIGIAQVPMRENTLVVAPAVLPGNFKTLKRSVAGEVIDPKVSPAAVVLNAILVVNRRAAGHAFDSHILDLQGGVRQRSAR